MDDIYMRKSKENGMGIVTRKNYLIPISLPSRNYK